MSDDLKLVNQFARRLSRVIPSIEWRSDSPLCTYMMRYDGFYVFFIRWWFLTLIITMPTCA